MRTDPRANNNTSNSPIAQRRIALGMTQKQLAEVIGTTQAMIARWEAAKHAPNGTTLMKLSDALNCTMDELIKD